MFQRTIEATGFTTIAVHKKGSDGVFNPLGEVGVKKGKLVVYPARPTGHRERGDLARFAKALAECFGLSVEYKQRFSHLLDTGD